MNTITKVRLLETALMEVDPEAKVDFGYNATKYQWHAGAIVTLDKKGNLASASVTVVPSALSDYEQEQLLSALQTKLQWIQNDYAGKAKTAERILKAVNDRDTDY
jgi:hypothetical protein